MQNKTGPRVERERRGECEREIKGELKGMRGKEGRERECGGRELREG